MFVPLARSLLATDVVGSKWADPGAAETRMFGPDVMSVLEEVLRGGLWLSAGLVFWSVADEMLGSIGMTSGAFDVLVRTTRWLPSLEKWTSSIVSSFKLIFGVWYTSSMMFESDDKLCQRNQVLVIETEFKHILREVPKHNSGRHADFWEEKSK
jgi:hypothetical protein